MATRVAEIAPGGRRFEPTEKDAFAALSLVELAGFRGGNAFGPWSSFGQRDGDGAAPAKNGDQCRSSSFRQTDVRLESAHPEEVAGSSPASSTNEGPQKRAGVCFQDGDALEAWLATELVNGGDPLLTMERLRQPVADGGTDLGGFRGPFNLPLIATGCNHGAP